MEFVADLHFHSKYSRAVSQSMILPIMAEYAKKKGIHILTTSDFTHPVWFKELKANLTEVSQGLYKIKGKENDSDEPFFLFSVEVASIYNHNGKLRRIHNLLFAPSIEAAEKVNQALARHGVNLMSDGRPMMGLNSKQVLELILGVDENCFLIPCHAWTPHFGIYGSASGYDSLSECFGDLAKHIYGIETGLSSDPFMNWQIPELNNRSILSFSDAHSPAKMGREATVFTTQIANRKSQIDNAKLKITYDDIFGAIKQDSKDTLRIGYTIEFYPEEGKYHYSGHRNCQVSYTPEETEEKGFLCPVCKRRLTEGVMYRVEQLAKKSSQPAIELKPVSNSHGLVWKTDPGTKRPPYVSLVPLLEIIGEALEVGSASQRVKDLYDQMTVSLGSELDILLRVDTATIATKAGERVAQGIKKVREGTIVIVPGYDGVYGVVKIWNEEGRREDQIDQTSTKSSSQLGLEF